MNNVAEILFNVLVISYGIPAYLLADSGSQFVRKCFETLCSHLDTMHLTTTASHLQISGQVERYNKTTISRLEHYVASRQRDWDSMVHPLNHAYNSQVHRSTNTTPFNLVIFRRPPEPATFDAPSALPTGLYHKTHSQSFPLSSLTESKPCTTASVIV